MKKSTAAISSLLLLGGLSSLHLLAASVRNLDLRFDLRDDEELHFC